MTITTETEAKLETTKGKMSGTIEECVLQAWEWQASYSTITACGIQYDIDEEIDCDDVEDAISAVVDLFNQDSHE